MLTVLLLSSVAFITAQIQPAWRLSNENSVFAGSMSDELIGELADAAFSLWKADIGIPGMKRKKTKNTFMEYDDEMNRLDKLQDIGVDAPAPMVAINTPPPLLREFLHMKKEKEVLQKKMMSMTIKKPLPISKNQFSPPAIFNHHFSPPKISHVKKFRRPRPPAAADAYVLPPEGLSNHKSPRWAIISQRRIRIHGKGRKIRQPLHVRIIG